jgi:hypothetical protein
MPRKCERCLKPGSLLLHTRGRYFFQYIDYVANTT